MTTRMNKVPPANVKLRELERGMVVRDPRAESGEAVVLHTWKRRGGGAGMGEYPDSWGAVLSNGRVYEHNSWAGQPQAQFKALAVLLIDEGKSYGRGRLQED